MITQLHHLLLRSAERADRREALVCGDIRLSYATAWGIASSVGSGLRRAGVKRGDRIGILLKPSAEQALAFFAISAADAVAVPINLMLMPDQVAHIVRDCGMSALITTPKRLGAVWAAVRELSLRLVVLVGDDAPVDAGIETCSFDELARANDPAPAGRSISKDLSTIVYTSGSTGKPKGVMLSHANLVAGSEIVSRYLEISSDDRILAALPFTFDAGLNQLITAIHQGGTCVILRVFGDLVDTLVAERITGLAGVPTLWGLAVQPASAFARHEYPHLRYITNTGGALPHKVLEVLRRQLKTTRIFLMYGLTEAFRSTYLPPEELDRRVGSMGKAIPDTEILVVDEHGKPCAPGEVGELVHRGPTVSMGYWGQPEQTSQVLRPHPFAAHELGDSERVCYSGDLVRADDDGFLYFVGRRDTMIKSSGYRISPTEVEEVLFESGLVTLAAVIGIPDPELGQRIKAFVVFRDDVPQQAAPLATFCATRLPRYMCPHEIATVSELPKTSSGKIDYPALRSGAIGGDPTRG